MTMAFELIIFDYDGVLVDSLERTLSLSADFCRSIGHGRIPTRETIAMLDPMTYPELARSAGMPSLHIDAYTRHMFKGFRSAETTVRFFPGIKGLMHRLALKKTAIVSGNARDTIAARLAAGGLTGQIDLILGALEAGDKAAKIQTACEKAGVNRKQACMVGDAVSDIRSAKKAGVASIAVTWGWQPRKTLAKENPDYMVTSVPELRRLLLG